MNSNELIVVEGRTWVSYHGCSCGLGRHGCLMLTGFNFGLQVRRWVKILALVAAAAALDVVHANGDGVVDCVNHRAVAGVGEPAVGLSSSTCPSLELTTYLQSESRSDN